MKVQSYSKVHLKTLTLPYDTHSLHYRAKPIAVPARSKAWVCGRSLAGIVGSTPTGGTDICLLRVLCVVR